MSPYPSLTVCRCLGNMLPPLLPHRIWGARLAYMPLGARGEAELWLHYDSGDGSPAASLAARERLLQCLPVLCDAPGLARITARHPHVSVLALGGTRLSLVWPTTAAAGSPISLPCTRARFHGDEGCHSCVDAAAVPCGGAVSGSPAHDAGATGAPAALGRSIVRPSDLA